MARKGRRQVFDDGLDRIERVDADAITLKEIRQWTRRTGFKRMMRNTMRRWRRFRKLHPERMGDPNNPLSLAAIERYIRWAGAASLERLRRKPEQEADFYLVLSLGAKIADGAWRANRRPWALTGKKRHAGLAQASHLGVIARQTAQQEDDERIRPLWQELRARHPYDREHSTTWAAKELGRKDHRQWETLRKAAARLGVR